MNQQTESLLARQKREAAEQYVVTYGQVQGKNLEVINEDQVTPIGVMSATLNGFQNSIQVLSAQTYLQYGELSLRYWANQFGIFSIPTLELAEWLQRHCRERSIHEVGCGNAAMAKHLGIYCSDGRSNGVAQAIAKAVGSSSAVTPRWVQTKTANQAAQLYKPQIVLAQWVTPGGGNPKDPEDLRNGYGPDYSDILKHCKELIFIGNDSVHGDSLDRSLPQADETFRYPWLLSRARDQSQNFIKIWRTP